ncbi:MAG: FliM/FliN family flagellar motor switch protein [Pseudomonadota bacterium]
MSTEPLDLSGHAMPDGPPPMAEMPGADTAAAEVSVSDPTYPAVALSAALSPVWNAALSFAGAPIGLSGGGELTFNRAKRPSGEHMCHLVTVDAGQGHASCHALLVPTAYPFAARFNAELAMEDLENLPDAVSGALHAGVRDSWLTAVEPYLPVNAGPTARLAEINPPTALTWFEATLAQAGTQSSALIGIAPGQLCSLLSAHKLVGRGASGRARFAGLAARVPVPIALSLGAMPIALDGLRRLAPGDVLIMPTGAEGQRFMRSANAIFECQPAEGGWAVTRQLAAVPIPERPTAETPMTDAMQTESPEGAPEPMAAAPTVPLDLDIGAVEMSLAELEALAPGAVVPVEAGVEDGMVVTVRLNGRAIATGRLVQLEDRLAVQLTDVML